MNDYKTTVAIKNPDYIGKKLLLAKIDRSGLYKINETEIVELEFDDNGKLYCNFINGKHKKPKELSLRKIGIEFLGLNDPPVKKVLKYLIKPEMEIERIFNATRFKYLQSIYDSHIEDPSKLISCDYNRAFQSFAGIKVYQGNAKKRKPNDFYWKNAKLTKDAKSKINFESEINDLDFIILYLRNLSLPNYNNIYTELIAIKPGFHEIIIHDKYFCENDKCRAIPKVNDSDRDKVFKSLRGFGDISDITLNKLKPHEINRNNYFSYSPCSITEGPFVFRKKLNISYYDEIKKIHNIEDKQCLEDNFDIYNYFEKKPSSLKKLGIILKETERFKYYLNS